MNVGSLLGPEILDIAKAIGLVSSTGDLDGSWFDNPLARLEAVLTNTAQREALLDLLDQILPPQPVAGVPAGEKWHPLLGTQAKGNAYLTVVDADPVVVGIAGQFTALAVPAAQVLFRLPVAAISGTAFSAIAGTAAGPLQLSLAVALDWTIPAEPIALSGITAGLSLAPLGASPAANVEFTLLGLDLGDGKGAHDVLLSPADFGRETVQLALGLIRAQLHKLEATASGELKVLAENLPALLGLDGGLPVFPFATLGSDPRALQIWLWQLTTGAPAPIESWLGHLGALLGATAGATTAGDAWMVPVFAPNPSSSVNLTLGLGKAADGVTPVLTAGVDVALLPGTSPPARLDAAMTLLSLPLAGGAQPQAFPGGSVAVSAPGANGAKLVPLTGGFALDALRAGLSWNGTALKPLLELENVTMPGGAHYDSLDLSDANTVVQAASHAVATAIQNALGNAGAGRNLAALAGLVEPAADAGAPLVDLTKLVSNPTGAIADLHRAALLSAAHPWKNYLGEISGLLGLTGGIAGDGTPASPWLVDIETAGVLALRLAAWNAQTSGNVADPQQLRLALQLAITGARAQVVWSTELLSADLAAGGANALKLLGGHHATASITPGTIPPVAGIGIQATTMTAALDIVPGTAAVFKASIDGLAVTTPGGVVHVPTLSYPFPAGFDISNPAALGITTDELEQIVLALLTSELSSALGSYGLATAALFGAGANAPGLQVDFPALADPAGSGSLFTDPLAAVRAWINKVATGVSADGSSFIATILPWLAGWLGENLPPDLFTPADRSLVAGSGSYADPWLLPLGTDSPAAALLWLEPDGPPSMAALEAAAIAAAEDFDGLSAALSDASRFFERAVPAGLAGGLAALSDHLASTDGVVPVDSQIPTGGAWTSGTAIGAAHPLQPSDASAISQILAQVDGWAAPGTNRAVLLLGPAFLDHTAWAALLAQAEAEHAGTTNTGAVLNFRVSGVAPAAVDLRPVTAIADYYAVDLQDAGTGDYPGLSAQIGLAAARVLALKPGAALLLVAHSTAGIAARVYAAANPTQIKGLVTLGTPHSGAPLLPLTDPSTAEALRAITALLPGGVAAGPLKDALAHLNAAVDGYLPPPAPGALPLPFPYPYGDFAGSGSVDTGGVPALALGGQLGGTAGVNLLGTLQTAFSNVLTGAVLKPPTHLAFGARMTLPLGADTDVAATASVRVNAGRIALENAAPEPPRPAHSLSVDLALSRPGAWLAGGALSYAGLNAPLVDVRVRSAEFGAVFTLNGTALSAAPYAHLRDAAFHGVTLDAVEWGDAQLAASLGSIFASVAATAPAPGSALAGVLNALTAFGVCAPNVAGGIGIAADAITALTADPLGFLSSKAEAALSNGAVPGFSAAAGGFSLQPAALPFELFVATAPAVVELRTSGAGQALTVGAALDFSVALPLATLAPRFTAGLTVGPATLTFDGSSLTLAIPPALPPLQLYPAPSPAAALSAMTSALPWLLVEAAGTAVLDCLVSAGSTVTGLVSFLSDPGGFIVRTTALGDGTVLDPAKINQLLALIPPLPAGLTLTATGKDPTTISLGTGAPLGGVLSISLGVEIDRTRHIAPQGSFTLQANLAGGTWPSVGVMFGIDPAGISLSLQPGGAAAIELLPSFSGSAAFAGAAEALLPAALDGIVGALPAANPLLKLGLEVATALDLYDTAGGFKAHTAQLSAMIDGSWFSSMGSTARAAFLNAASAYFNDATSPLKGLLPGAISVSGSALSWSYPIPGGVGSGTLTMGAGWDGTGPTLHFAADTVTLDNAPFSLTAGFGYASGSLALNAALGISLAGLGIAAAPQLAFALNGGAPSLTLLPLGAGTSSTLSLQMLPSPAFQAGSDAPQQIATTFGIPLVADLLIAATGAQFTSPLWTGGPNIETVMKNAQIIDVGAGPAPGKYTLHTPLAPVEQMISNIAAALSPVTIPIVADPPLALTFSNAGNKLGLGLLGSLNLSTGSPTISLLFGKPADWLGPQAGITLDLFTTGASIDFAPALAVRGLGVGLQGEGDAPLVNASGFRMGAVDAYIAFTIDLLHGTVTGLGGGVEIDKLGLPLNLLSGAGSSNPVAASLFDTSGGSGQGDTTPANPTVDVAAYYLDGSFTLAFQGTTQPIVIPVHASFGPVYIDQIDLALPDAKTVEMGVGGSAKINGLDVGVDDLALSIPVNTLTTPSTWSLDLQGLAVGFSAGVVEISGGLRKTPGPPIEYDGMLSVTISGIGLTIVGAYSQPSDAQGSYTSLFMFISLPIPLGGPPFAFIMGLGGGFGLNRELQIPQDLNSIDSFLLVSAIDDSGLANDPMGALMKMSSSIPARRGAFWLAAGVRFTSFALVNSTVVVAIALDRGFEIDILGISRMALPTEDTALVSVELALKARYNSEEGVLSIQAQLTDNSYLFTRDCQLTGGFAFFIWFPQGQFVLTLGGYNPVFAKPAEFPDVPRLGFQFSVGSIIVIKGGAYFALTNSCVMAGGSLNATASIGPVSAWFNAFLDFLIAWDPFAYEFDIGVEIGASFSMRICFFGCVTIGITISVGAQLTIEGPPFHGTASIDAYITTITIAFGDDPQKPDYITDWGVFSGKYLTAGDANGNAVSLQFSKGVLAPDPPGAQPRPGTSDQPWQVGVEFAFQSTTRMPSTTVADFTAPGVTVSVPNMPVLDVAPMDELAIASAHAIALEQKQSGGSWAAPVLIDVADHFTIAPALGFFPEATWHWVDPYHLPAGARTITAVAGLSVDAHVAFNGQSALIPISTLVADLTAFALPLPFAFTITVTPVLQAYGAEAAALAAAIKGASSAKMLAASSTMLAGENIFSQNRAAFNLPKQGISPIAQLSLKQARSAPPLVMPMTAGLTMLPVGLGAPVVAEKIAPLASVVLEQPRLRAVMQRPARPVADTPPVMHTTVRQAVGVGGSARAAAASGIPRMKPPVLAGMLGARLIRVASATGPRPLRASTVSRTLRNAAGGTAIAPAHQAALDAASAALITDGVTLAGGASHVWELHQDAGTLEVRGTGALRVVFAKRGGAPMSDIEMAVTQSASIPVPAGAALAVVESLGALPAGATAPPSGFAAITAAFAPAQQQIAVGWQSGSLLIQAGPTRLLARGATLRLPRNFGSITRGQRASYGAAIAKDALAGQSGVETELPAGISVLMIALDGVEGAIDPDSLAIGIVGATLAATPVRVSNANRRLLLYDVVGTDPGAIGITVSIASINGWNLAGVIGVHGTATEWATRLEAGIAAHFVPEGPLTPQGELTIAWQPPAALGKTPAQGGNA